MRIVLSFTLLASLASCAVSMNPKEEREMAERIKTEICKDMILQELIDRQVEAKEKK